jgi:hypothetical protein
MKQSEELRMQSKKPGLIGPLFSCVLVNAVLLILIFVMARQILMTLHQWVSPFMSSGDLSLPVEARSAFAGVNQLLGETSQYLAPVIFGLGMIFTLVLWLIIRYQGRRLMESVQGKASAASGASQVVGEETAGMSTAHTPSPQTSQPPQTSPQSAVQMLAILQREGRLVDFLREDLGPYSDDQIGAAVRSIHQGCRAALQEHLDLRPILEEAEGNEVPVPPDFDPRAIRLTGNVSGDPPFKGILKHHGWRVVRIDLPRISTLQETDWILTPAEVEIAD